MIYSTRDLLDKGETEYSIRNKVKEGSLFLIERGYYSDKAETLFINDAFISKKYPYAILAGLSAFAIHGLTDYIPDHFYLATEQHSFPIRRKDVIQSYQDSSFFEVGSIEMKNDEGSIRTYDLERLLIELFRLKEKYPREIYYDVLSSFRKNKEKIDFYKLNQYLRFFSNGSNLLQKIKETL